MLLHYRYLSGMNGTSHLTEYLGQILKGYRT